MMAPVNTLELVQSAKQCTALAASFVKGIEAMRNLEQLRQNGLFVTSDLTAAQLLKLGLNDPSEIDKWLDLTVSLDDLHGRSLIARGLAG